MQDKTLDLNKVIAFNIVKAMNEKNITPNDLAMHLNVSKQIMSKILSGDRTITAIELNKITTYLKIKMDQLFVEDDINENIYISVTGTLETEEAKNAILIAVRLSNMVCKYDILEERLKESMEEQEL